MQYIADKIGEGSGGNFLKFIGRLRAGNPGSNFQN
jgi:hypothetical protein